MYERFTDRARKAMQLADREAQRLNRDFIDAPHVAVGVFRAAGVACKVIEKLGTTPESVIAGLELPTGDDQVVMGRLPHTPQTKKVIEYSIEEARNLNHNWVGTEHLLLGLARVGGVPFVVDDARAAVLDVLKVPPVIPPLFAIEDWANLTKFQTFGRSWNYLIQYDDVIVGETLRRLYDAGVPVALALNVSDGGVDGWLSDDANAVPDVTGRTVSEAVIFLADRVAASHPSGAFAIWWASNKAIKKSH